jgi:two-component system, cell cycle response regulator
MRKTMEEHQIPPTREDLEKRVSELESLVVDLDWALRKNEENYRALRERQLTHTNQEPPAGSSKVVAGQAICDLSHILVVDDELAIRQLLSEALGGTGYVVSVARDGREALHLAYQERFDVAVVDVKLPGMDGMDLLRQLKRVDADLSVILVTGHASVESAVQALRHGAYDYFTKPINLDQMRATVVRALERRFLVQEAEQKEAYRRLSNTDGLTGLANHRHFRKIIDQETYRSKRYGHRFCLLMIDVDHFKVYNDLNGHPAGDRALRTMAQVLMDNVRATDFVARYGGEEFAVILPETALDAGLEISRNLRRLVESSKFEAAEGLPGGRMTVSIGIASFPADAATADELLEAADAALYVAKRQGRNRVCAV